MILRPYQTDCVAQVRQALASANSTLAVLATGLGKTVIFAHLVGDWPGRCLVLAHRDELIRQAAAKIEAVTGEPPGVEMGDEYIDEGSAFRPRVVVSSVQTMCRPKRQARFDPADFGLVVIDEAHHSVARTYKAVVDYYRRNPSLKLLGVTATPKRTDQLAMGQVFAGVAYEFGIEPAVEEGWLVPVRQQAVVVEGLDFSSVRSVAGDFNEGELDRILSEEKVLHQVAAPAAEVAGDRPALVFCVSVNHARLMASVLCRYKPESAVALDGTSPPELRRETVAAYKAGQIQFLCNCGLYLEGFDAPNTAVVVMARPTKSLALYTQILGRGTRPLPGVVDGLASADARRRAVGASAKPWMLALDFVGNSGRHRIVTAADLLGGKFSDAVRQYARRTLEAEGGGRDVNDSLGRAADELALIAEIRDRERRREIKARSEHRLVERSPFAGGGPAFDPGRQPRRGDPATAKQVGKLVWLGVARETAQRYTKGQASAVIAKLQARRGKAS